MNTARFLFLTLFCSLILGVACTKVLGPEITDETVDKYIKANENLRKLGPELLKKAHASEGGDLTAGMEGYAQVEKAVRDAGFESYREFVVVNAKIGAAFSMLEGRGFMTKMEKMNAIGTEEIDKQLADPNLPPETRAELEQAKKTIRENYEKNKPWAEGVLKGVDMVVDEQTEEVIKRNQDRLRVALAGVELPKEQFMGRDL